MTSRTKAKDTKADEPSKDTAAQSTEMSEDAPLCGAIHTLPVLAHVTCQRPAGHPDDQPQAPDQGKHLARAAGALYVW